MQIQNLTAEPDPRGGRILLSWTNPADSQLAGIKILRRESTFPVVPDDFGSPAELFVDGHPQPGLPASFVDHRSLKGETVYYYAVVAQDTGAAQFPAFVTAMATSNYDTGRYLYANLPGIYRTFDTVTPPSFANIDPADRTKGQLQRFAEMFGLQFDMLRSYAAAMRDFHDADRVDGNLLPLLAQWLGWQTDFTLPISKQRNEINYATHFFRTRGVPANLRAVINRISTWDAQIKEFAHNIFRSTDPEQLTISEAQRFTGVWQQPVRTTLDVAHQGRPASLSAIDGRSFIFYHARESTPGDAPASGTRSHIWYKAFDQDGNAAAQALTSGASINRSPSVVQRPDGSLWLFFSTFIGAGSRLVPKLNLRVFGIGRDGVSSRIQSVLAGPFTIADGDQLKIKITTSATTIVRVVTLRAEDFSAPGPVAAQQLASVLDRELPSIDVTALDERIIFSSQPTGSDVSLQIANSQVATALGIASPATASGADPLAAVLTSTRSEPFALAAGDQLVLLRDGDSPRTVTFTAGEQVANLAAAKASEVAAAINAVIHVASSAGGKLVLSSPGTGESAVVGIDVSASSAAAKLGFGNAPPSGPAAVNQPFALSAGSILVISGNSGFSRTVTFQKSDFAQIGSATAAEVALAVNAAVPGAVTAQTGSLVLSSTASIDMSGASVAAKLGLAGPTQPIQEPFALVPGDQLTIKGNSSLRSTVVFQPAGFANITAATAAEVAVAINGLLPGAASAQGGRVVLSPLVSADDTASRAAFTLGLASPDEDEPASFIDSAGRTWLFWSSRRSGAWKIWFNRFDGNAWGVPRQLTTGPLPDREPGVLFDPGPGRIWVFWGRKKANGLWNVFFRQTTNLNFDTLADGDWTEAELAPVPPAPPTGYDNREPMPLLLGPDSLELYFSSNRNNGWNVWSKPLSSAAQGADLQITFGQFTQRAPAPLKAGANDVRLWFRSNETQIYTSAVYPAAQTIDARYAGSTTADTRNPARLSLRENIRDIQHYTYHAVTPPNGRTPAEILQLEQQRLYSRDTAGIYLTPDTNDEQLIVRNRGIIAAALQSALPIQVRAVLLIDQAFPEAVFDYAGGGKAGPLIDERMIDTIANDALLPVTDEFADTADFKFVRTWSAATPSGGTTDLSVHPPDLSFRMPISGIGEEK